MKKKFLLLFIALLMFFSSDAFGWSRTAVHGPMSSRLLKPNDPNTLPYLRPYIAKFDQIGLDANHIIDLLTIVEPGSGSYSWLPHTNWNDLNDGTSADSFFLMTCDDVNMLLIMHAAEDSGSVHTPGSVVWTGIDPNHFSDAHNAMEDSAAAQGYYAGNPALTCDAILTGSWFDKMSTYYVDSCDVAQDYKDWYYSQSIPLGGAWGGHDYDDVDAAYIEAHLMQSLRMSVAAMSQYFDYREVTEPGSTVAHWAFNEGSGQITVNSKGSIAAHLTLGSDTSTDSHDPNWDTGLCGSALHCKSWAEAGSNTTYAIAVPDWTQFEYEALSPKASYTIEVVFKADTYVAGTYMGLVTYKDYRSALSTKYQYLVRTYKSSGNNHTYIELYSDTNDTVTLSFPFDTNSAGMQLVPGTWYYVAAVYHDATRKADLIVRNIDTGLTVSEFGHAFGPIRRLDWANAEPRFLIGSYTTTTNTNFDGCIDDVRVSNRALVLDSDRLYNATVGHWKFNEGSGQITKNSKKNTDTYLILGSTASVDTHDPNWGTGLCGSALHGKSFAEANSNTTYARSPAGVWDQNEFEALSPKASYTVEAMFKADTYAADTDMGLISYKDYRGALGDRYQYSIRTYKSSSNNHTYMTFYSHHTDSTSTTFSIDTNSLGMQLVPDTWYYVAAIYHHLTGTADLIVRDIATGQTVSELGHAFGPIRAFDWATAEPRFMVGSYTTTTNTNFDGLIDEVRISNDVVDANDRLYMHALTAGHWIFNGDSATDDQVIENINTDFLLNLHLGKYLDVDSRDASIEPETGWFGGSLRTYDKAVCEANDPNEYINFVSSEYNWNADVNQAEHLLFDGSYSMEVVFKADYFPTVGDENYVQMGLVTYRDYAPANDITMYELMVWKDANEAADTYVHFLSMYSTTVGYWKFDEGSGQIAVNSKQNADPNSYLTLGLDVTPDAYDPNWDTGLVGNCLHFKSWAEAGSTTTYARSPAGVWSQDQYEALSPKASYTIEAVFKADTYAAGTYMGLVTYKDYRGALSDKYQYSIQTYKSSGNNHTYVKFYSNTSDDVAVSFALDTNSLGMQLVPGTWYYVAAVYNDSTHTADLIVRDIATGQTVSEFGYAFGPIRLFDWDNAEPRFMVGSYTTTTNTNFDGCIDSVRVSNRALVLDSGRLYESSDCNETILWNTSNSGLDIQDDVWYYLGAFFNADSNSMYFYLRNLQTGASAQSSPQTMRPMTGLALAPDGTSTPAPCLLIGTNTRGSKSFSGWIDDVRVSSGLLPADTRLYNYRR